MGGNVELEGLSGTIYRQVSIMINDASDTTLQINTYAVTSGQWDPEHTPKLGQGINPGDNPTFINYTNAPYTAVSGFITLVPLSGGQIKLNWEWKYGSPFSNTSSTQGTTLGVSSQIVGQTSTTVTVQYQITASSS